MKTSMISVKVDEKVKKRAQAVAGSFGIPLSTLVNAYLIELGETGRIHFETSRERLSPEVEARYARQLKQFEKDKKAGKITSFDNVDDFLAELKAQ